MRASSMRPAPDTTSRQCLLQDAAKSVHIHIASNSASLSLFSLTPSNSSPGLFSAPRMLRLGSAAARECVRGVGVCTARWGMEPRLEA